MSSSIGSAEVPSVLHLPSSPRTYAPRNIVLDSPCPPTFPSPSPFSDPSIIAQLELFSNYPLPASFLRDIPLPEWPDLGFEVVYQFWPCVLANLCLLSHGEAIGLPSPLFHLRFRLYLLASHSTSPPPSDPRRSFFSWLSLLREEVTRRRSLFFHRVLALARLARWVV